jgi:hypothetical protein
LILIDAHPRCFFFLLITNCLSKFPNKMTHEQALTIDKFGDGLKTIEVADRTGTALDGNIHSLQDMTGGRKQKKYDGTSTMGSTGGGGSSSLSGH